MNKDTTRKGNYIPVFLMFIDAKLLDNMQGKQIQHVQRLIHHGQLEFIPEMQEWFNI
jgi:hypothetical protein